MAGVALKTIKLGGLAGMMRAAGASDSGPFPQSGEQDRRVEHRCRRARAPRLCPAQCRLGVSTSPTSLWSPISRSGRFGRRMAASSVRRDPGSASRSLRTRLLITGFMAATVRGAGKVSPVAPSNITPAARPCSSVQALRPHRRVRRVACRPPASVRWRPGSTSAGLAG